LVRVPTFTSSLAWTTLEWSMVGDYIAVTMGTVTSLSEGANSVAWESSV
jgi:hypothetical protein